MCVMYVSNWSLCVEPFLQDFHEHVEVVWHSSSFMICVDGFEIYLSWDFDVFNNYLVKPCQTHMPWACGALGGNGGVAVRCRPDRIGPNGSGC